MKTFIQFSLATLSLATTSLAFFMLGSFGLQFETFAVASAALVGWAMLVINATEV